MEEEEDRLSPVGCVFMRVALASHFLLNELRVGDRCRALGAQETYASTNEMDYFTDRYVDVGFLSSYAFSTPFHFRLIYHGPNTIAFFFLFCPPIFATGGQPEAANRNYPSAEKEHLHGQDVGRGWPTARDTKTDQIASDAQGALRQGLRHALVRRFSITRVSIAGW